MVSVFIMKSKNNRIIGTLALVLLSFFISIVLAEIVLRQMIPIGISKSYKHRIPHPVFGWVLEPGASYINRTSEGAVRVTYNSGGWRDVEHSFENTHGTFRILVLGDSFMEGYSVELEDMFHRQIERLARKNEINIEVINLGVGGYGTLQEYLVFREIGKRYKPNLVLLGFFMGNDVSNNSFALESILNAGSTKVQSRPFLDSTYETTWKITQVDYDGARRRYSASIAKRDSLFRRIPRQSALIQAISLAKKRIRSMWLGNNGHDADNINTLDTEEKEKKRRLALFGVNYCQEHPEYTKAWFTTKRILERLKSDVSSIGGELFVFTVPAISDVIAAETKDIPHEIICLEDGPSYDRLKGILNELDIGYVDLLPSFRKITRNDGLNLFLSSDDHWNEKGHHVAAKTVYSALIDGKHTANNLMERKAE